MDMRGDLETVLEGIWPGQRMMPGTIIGEKDHPSILGEAKSLQSLKHPTNGVVDFFDDIPIEPLFGMPFEVITDVEGNVGHVVG